MNEVFQTHRQATKQLLSHPYSMYQLNRHQNWVDSVVIHLMVIHLMVVGKNQRQNLNHFHANILFLGHLKGYNYFSTWTYLYLL